MKIALCDDNRYDMEQLKQLIAGYSKADRIKSASEYTTAEELLEAVRDGADFDIIITDISLPERSGIELGMELNEIMPDARIIFVSANPEYFQDVYYVEHIQFMSKPIEPERLYYALDKAVEMSTAEYITVFDKQTHQRIDKKTIIYIEASNHDTLVCRTEGISKYRIPFGEFIQLLEGNEFIRCHRGFLVNMAHITRLGSKSVSVTGGVEVPVGRTYSVEVKESILKFWGDSI